MRLAGFNVIQRVSKSFLRPVAIHAANSFGKLGDITRFFSGAFVDFVAPLGRIIAAYDERFLKRCIQWLDRRMVAEQLFFSDPVRNMLDFIIG
jgi:hypothetical protein